MTGIWIILILVIFILIKMYVNGSIKLQKQPYHENPPEQLGIFCQKLLSFLCHSTMWIAYVDASSYNMH